jgi:hypothetical protein
MRPDGRPNVSEITNETALPRSIRVDPRPGRLTGTLGAPHPELARPITPRAVTSAHLTRRSVDHAAPD